MEPCAGECEDHARNKGKEAGPDNGLCLILTGNSPYLRMPIISFVEPIACEEPVSSHGGNDSGGQSREYYSSPGHIGGNNSTRTCVRPVVPSNHATGYKLTLTVR